MNAENGRIVAARVAFDARLDREFGGGPLIRMLARAVADGIERLHHPDAPVDEQEVRHFVESVQLEAIADVVAELAGDDDLAGSLEEAISDIDPDDVLQLLEVIGPVEELGGFDSSNAAVMTASSWTWYSITRKGLCTTFGCGSEEMLDGFVADEPWPLEDDPSCREARLDIARSLGGLLPGMWIADADEIDNELREVTLSEPRFVDVFTEAVSRSSNYLLERSLDLFEAHTGLAEASARERLRTIVQDPRQAHGAERSFIWEMHKHLVLKRPRPALVDDHRALGVERDAAAARVPMATQARTADGERQPLRPEAERILNIFRKRNLIFGTAIHPDDFEDAIVWENGFVRDDAVRLALVELFERGYLVEYCAKFELTLKGARHIYGNDLSARREG